jgi:hypothetical protein
VVEVTVYRACSSTTTVSKRSDGDFKLDGTSLSDSQLLIYVQPNKNTQLCNDTHRFTTRLQLVTTLEQVHFVPCSLVNSPFLLLGVITTV